ncbi:hypothetical protein E2C01_059943 [Portunus trituberculatus]|uniref:Uncharacterized protein n=1 Tax=Portunus trituberculatus TaxID=210409 RepID=A0A5B7H954_PORTR|nr:hypothetical protein [Portunus trituberculatus]
MNSDLGWACWGLPNESSSPSRISPSSSPEEIAAPDRDAGIWVPIQLSNQSTNNHVQAVKFIIPGRTVIGERSTVKS